MSTKQKSWLAAVVGLLLVVGVIVGIKAAQIRTMIRAGKSFTPPPQAVTSAEVHRVEWEETTPAVATLVAVHAGTLGAELPGVVREIHFDSGSLVKEGAVLVRLDTSVEEAQLAGAVADARLAASDLDRTRTLRRSGSNTLADLDAAEARAKQAASVVATLRATIAKKTIRAPFTGRIAIRQIDLGQLVAPGTAVASLQSVTPIFADFWLPQRALSEVRAGQAVHLRVDTAPRRTWDGEIATINPEVDPVTRNVRVRATFANADGELRPGMFGNVEVVAPAKQSVIVIPNTAVLYAPYGDSVFVVEKRAPDSLLARQRAVHVGARRGDYVVVESGLKEGETVVGTGAFKLHGDSPVIVDNSLVTKPSLTPEPGRE